MAISDSMALMALTVVLTLWICKENKFLQGIILMVTGITTYLWLPTDNPYGWIIMALGIAIILFSPLLQGSSDIRKTYRR